MKKVIAALLLLSMILTLTACGKEPSVTDLLDYPIGSKSVSECKKFLKNCGFEVESATDAYINFKGDAWSGIASMSFPYSVTLNYNQFLAKGSFEDTLKTVQAELKAACGEPYASDTNTMLKMTTEFYSYGDKVIHVAVTTSPMNSIGITMMPAPSK